jgi:hypothetical protein
LSALATVVNGCAGCGGLISAFTHRNYVNTCFDPRKYVVLQYDHPG